jgi:hypothetical protein
VGINVPPIDVQTAAKPYQLARLQHPGYFSPDVRGAAQQMAHLHRIQKRALAGRPIFVAKCVDA